MSTIGVLGGLGPAATVDFLGKLVRLTPARRDQEHIPVVTACLPHVPDRSACILGVGPDPLPHLLRGIALLNNVGVGVVAVPCNSAHHWYAQLSEHSRAPIIHIAQACVDRLQQPPGSRVMVLATRGALQSGFYQRALVQAGMVALQPDAPSQCWVDDCIRLIKAADLPGGGAALEQVLEHARAQGVSALIMGCTEIPIAAQYAHIGEMACADSSLALADAVVGYALQRRWHLAMRDAPHGTLP